MFNFNESKQLYGEKLLELIAVELKKRNVTTFLASGTTKVVYNTTNPKLVIKVVVCDKTNLNRFIREPNEMNKNKLCNTPIDIKVINNENIGTYSVIIWSEEKATCTDVEHFPSNLKQSATEWYNTSKTQLEDKGFTDLGKVNVGYFTTAPIFRWIDIQPKMPPAPPPRPTSANPPTPPPINNKAPPRPPGSDGNSGSSSSTRYKKTQKQA